jgi:putative ABC transport system permease protein
VIGLLGAVAEAWGEVRVHKSRVVLSLIGVFFAVLAMTTVTALGQMTAQAAQEQNERYGGRPATLAVQPYDSRTGMPFPDDRWKAAIDDVVARFEISHYAVIQYDMGLYRMPGGTQQIQTTRVSPSYAELHRIQPVQGRWFRDADRQNLSPSLVVNEDFLTQLGVADISGRPTVVIGGATPALATIVGVIDEDLGGQPSAYRIDTSAGPWDAGEQTPSQFSSGPPSLELWVPDADADAVVAAVSVHLSALFDGAEVGVFRQDAGDQEKFQNTLRWVVRGAGLLVLFLGALGVLNVGLVTVRQRIREIGVRRSFGATSGRVFAAIMLESVVATFLAGLVAVVCSVALVRALPLDQILNGGQPLQDVPAFPVAAAIEGLLAATAVGALAGLLPAIIAVRAKVIDAIRF